MFKIGKYNKPERFTKWPPVKKKKKPKVKNKRIKKPLSKNYAKFLKTSYWKKVRLLVFKRDGFKCVICGSTENINVHHSTYKHHFDELNHLDDLITLCKNCHNEAHGIIPDYL